MNRKSYILLLMVALLSLVSCGDDEEEPQNDNILTSGPTVVTCSIDKFIANETRTTLSKEDYSVAWAKDDVIGIFPYEGYQEPFYIPTDQMECDNAKIDGGYWRLKNGMKYNAYYPFSTDNFKVNSKKHLPVTYLGQKENSPRRNLGSFDYMYSDWTEVENGKVNFNFHHLGALLALTIKWPNGIAYRTLTLEFEGKEIPVEGYYDIMEETPHFITTRYSDCISMELNRYAHSVGEKVTFYFMLPPADMSSTYVTATLEREGDTHTYKLPSIKFEAGHIYAVDAKEFKYEAVDLGLSVEWATCNVGAAEPEEYGDYYAWGEKEPHYEHSKAYEILCTQWQPDKKGYDWYTYDWFDAQGQYANMTKYNSDDKIRYLKPEDDIVQTEWRGKWRMPSRSEIAELTDETKCRWKYYSNYNDTGAAGFLITSLVPGYTDKSIFLPAAGYRYSLGLYEYRTVATYWSNTVNSSNPRHAYYLYICEYRRLEPLTDSFERCYGRCIRPVREKE